MTKLEQALRRRFDLGKRKYCRSGWMWYLGDDKVIKVTQDASDVLLPKRFEKLLSYLQKENNESVVKIYEHGSFVVDNDAPYCYHVMEKLKPIPRDIYEDVFGDLLYDCCKGRKKPPVFVSQEFIDFVKNAKKLKYRYHDLHTRNIMMDHQGKFKFVDLESFLE